MIKWFTVAVFPYLHHWAARTWCRSLFSWSQMLLSQMASTVRQNKSCGLNVTCRFQRCTGYRSSALVSCCVENKTGWSQSGKTIGIDMRCCPEVIFELAIQSKHALDDWTRPFISYSLCEYAQAQQRRKGVVWMPGNTTDFTVRTSVEGKERYLHLPDKYKIQMQLFAISESFDRKVRQCSVATKYGGTILNYVVVRNHLPFQVLGQWYILSNYQVGLSKKKFFKKTTLI